MPGCSMVAEQKRTRYQRTLKLLSEACLSSFFSWLMSVDTLTFLGMGMVAERMIADVMPAVPMVAEPPY